MLKIRNLESGYGKLRVLRGISLHVSPGEIVIIIGANGAGKTTLLKTVSGILKARAGTVHFQDRSIGSAGMEEIVCRGCVLVPEGRQLFGTLSIKDNLTLGAYLIARTGKHREVKQRLDEIYELFPVLHERQDQLAGTLSGGEQQMVAIGRGLMSNPTILMLDEPSLGLAPKLVEKIFETILEINKSGVTIFLVEQNAHMALTISSTGYVMETGRVVLTDKASALLENEEVKKAYLGE